MPKFLEVNGYKFSVYANECHEPPHVHIRKSGCEAKYWLEAEEFHDEDGYNKSEIKKIKDILDEHNANLIEAWIKWCQAIPS